jgi:hypothetical protein
LLISFDSGKIALIELTSKPPDLLLAVPPDRETTKRRLAWIIEITPGALANLTLHIGDIADVIRYREWRSREAHLSKFKFPRLNICN